MVGAGKDNGKRGAVRHACGLLKAARRASRQLKNRDDEESLHRFRVRVRRLRAFLKAYREPLGAKRIRTTCDKLGQLIDSTNTSRDLQVQQRWLDRTRTRTRLRPRAQESARWMAEHLSADPSQARDLQPKRLAQRYRKATKRLQTRLVRLADQGPDGTKHDPAFMRFAGRKIMTTADKLERLLASISGPDDLDHAHRARLSAKRLRYILEPIRKSTDGAPAAVTDLRHLQDMLGELRDRQVLEAEITKRIGTEAGAWADELIRDARGTNGPSSDQNRTGHQAICLGLRDLVLELRHEQHVLYRRLERTWFEDHGRVGLRRARAVGEGLARDQAATQA